MKQIKLKLAVLAVIIGTGLAIASSPVFESNANKSYGQAADGTWYDLDNLPPNMAVTCPGSGICHAEYTSDPSAPGADPDQLRVDNTAVDGTFTLVPIP